MTSYPTLDGEIPIPLIDVWGYFLSAQAQQPIPALTFLAEYLAVEETLMQWSLAVGMPPAHRDAHARLDDVDPVLGGFQLPSEAVPSTHLTPAGPQGEEALAVIEWVLEILLTQGYDDILLDPAAVMDEAADRIRALVGADA